MLKGRLLYYYSRQSLFMQRPLMVDNYFLHRPVIDIATRSVVCASEKASIADIIGIMLETGYRRIPIVFQRRLVGIVSSIDLLRYLLIGHGLEKQASHIMTRSVYVIKWDETVKEALSISSERKRGAYPLVKNGMVEGIVSDVDFIRQLTSPVGVRVSEIMTYKPVTVLGHYRICEVAKIFVRGGFRRLPVVDKNGKLGGIVTPFDILDHLNRKEKLGNLLQEKTGIGSIMAKHVISLGMDADVYEAARIILDKKVGGLPVVNETLEGIITEHDISRLLSSLAGSGH